jgi:hypothetical protein
VQSVFSEVGIAHAYSSFLCTLYTVGLCNSLFKNALPPANVCLLDSAYALKLINEVHNIFEPGNHALTSLQVSPHVGAPLARVARNRGVDEDAYTQVRARVTHVHRVDYGGNGGNGGDCGDCGDSADCGD